MVECVEKFHLMAFDVVNWEGKGTKRNEKRGVEDLQWKMHFLSCTLNDPSDLQRLEFIDESEYEKRAGGNVWVRDHIKHQFVEGRKC